MKRAALFITLLLPVTLLFGLVFVLNGRVQAKPQMIDVGGSISTDTTWTFDNSPYVITDTVTVEAGVTLTIEAGVTVMTTVEQDLIVLGHLEAVGTAVAPILFTSIDNLNTNSWTGPDIQGSANFENVTMRYADVALIISGSGGGDVFLANSLFEENSAYPIVADIDALHRLQMENVTFSNNVPNRVGINRIVDGVDQWELAGNVLLTSQPGLEAYEDLGSESMRDINVPLGMTLTLASGTTFMSNTPIDVQGHLQANGTALEPVIFDDGSGGGFFIPHYHYLLIKESGSASLVHTIIQNGSGTGLGIDGQSDQPVKLQDVVLDNVGEAPLIVTVPSLHRLQMTNVTFQNNTVNRILVDISGGQNAITTDVTLTSQPGLEWYEFDNGSDPPTLPEQFVVPEGITLTVESGVELRFGDRAAEFVVRGHLETNGTELEPVIFDYRPGGGIVMPHYLFFPETGSASLVHTIIRNGSDVGLGIDGQSDQPVILQDVVLDNMGDYPLIVTPPSLHRVQMDNVTFLNNTTNRVLVDTTSGDAIAGDVTLTAQPGLEAYEFTKFSAPPGQFTVSSGVTMTVESGVELQFGIGAEEFVVNGRLQAIGIPMSPITFTSAADSAPGEWEGVVLQGGSSQLENVVVRNGRENVLVGSLQPTATVQISNSTISNSSQTPLGIQTSNLHQTSLSNITFTNNVDGNNIVLYGEAMLGGDAVLNDQLGLDAYIVLDGSLSHWFVVPPTTTLSIDPGVMLKFNESGGDFGLRVEGELNTAGTQSEPVIFTSLADSAPNQWSGIVIENGTAELNYAEVRNGESNVVVNNTAFSTPIILQNSHIHDAGSVGLSVIDGTVTASCSRFINNGGSGVLVWDSGNPDVTIVSSALVGNIDAGLRNENANTVDARQNWWGDHTGPTGIGSGSGDAVLGDVLFAPWLPEETCTTVPYRLYLPSVVKP